MLNACTIDVEDYFQVSNFEALIPRSEWPKYPSRVVANTERVLESLAHHGVRGTFFVLGWIAERYPQLVRRIQDDGHEIGSHSHEHRLIYQMTPEEFRADLRRSKDTLEQILGEPISSYRAPSFSITRRSLHAIEILIEEGIRVDSSIFPTRHDRYGIPDAPVGPYRIRTRAGELIEFPPSVCSFAGFRIPVAGGGYFRLYPLALTRYLVRRINQDQRPANLYLHPWEFDPDQPRVQGASRLARFRHYVNLGKTKEKLSRLLNVARFACVRQVLEESGTSTEWEIEMSSGQALGRLKPVHIMVDS